MIKYLNEVIDEPKNEVFIFHQSYPLGQKVIIDCETFWLSEKKLKHKFVDFDQLRDKVELKGVIEANTHERFNSFSLLIRWEDNSKTWVPHFILTKI